MGLSMLVVFVLFPLFLLSLVVSGIVILISGKGKRLAAARTILLLYAVGFGLGILSVIVLVLINQVLGPMKVSRGDVIGTYRVDRQQYPGPQAEWQYEHFVLEITENDSVVLRSKDINGDWHRFSRPIIPQQYTNYRWRFPSEAVSTAHHILANTPAMYRQRWSFYYVFRSPRFGNMFFRKED